MQIFLLYDMQLFAFIVIKAQTPPKLFFFQFYPIQVESQQKNLHRHYSQNIKLFCLLFNCILPLPQTPKPRRCNNLEFARK